MKSAHRCNCDFSERFALSIYRDASCAFEVGFHLICHLLGLGHRSAFVEHVTEILGNVHSVLQCCLCDANLTLALREGCLGEYSVCGVRTVV